MEFNELKNNSSQFGKA